MLKADAIAHFDGSPVAVARALGITRSAVNQWGDRVPLDKALRLQAITDGVLSVDMSDYDLPDLSMRSSERHASA
jgi:transcriptional repressor of cell division inhibition gene dicB